jgi:hypothetical protein
LRVGLSGNVKLKVGREDRGKTLTHTVKSRKRRQRRNTHTHTDFTRPIKIYLHQLIEMIFFSNRYFSI